MKKKIGILFILALILVVCLFIYCIKFSNSAVNNQSLNIDIQEKLVFSTTINEDGKIEDSPIQYIYNFQDNSLVSFQGDKYIRLENNSYLKSGNHTIDGDNGNGTIYIDGKKAFQCNQAFCPFYLDESGNFIVFIDKNVYEYGPFKKAFGLRIMRVLDINKKEYKDFPVLKSQGKEIDLNGFVGYIN